MHLATDFETISLLHEGSLGGKHFAVVLLFADAASYGETASIENVQKK